ncbi:MAG: hypothetical protein ABDH21_00340 [bacterium]
MMELIANFVLAKDKKQYIQNVQTSSGEDYKEYLQILDIVSSYIAEYKQALTDYNTNKINAITESIFEQIKDLPNDRLINVIDEILVQLLSTKEDIKKRIMSQVTSDSDSPDLYIKVENYIDNYKAVLQEIDSKKYLEEAPKKLSKIKRIYEKIFSMIDQPVKIIFFNSENISLYNRYSLIDIITDDLRILKELLSKVHERMHPKEVSSGQELAVSGEVLASQEEVLALQEESALQEEVLALQEEVSALQEVSTLQEELSALQQEAISEAEEKISISAQIPEAITLSTENDSLSEVVTQNFEDQQVQTDQNLQEVSQDVEYEAKTDTSVVDNLPEEKGEHVLLLETLQSDQEGLQSYQEELQSHEQGTEHEKRAVTLSEVISKDLFSSFDQEVAEEKVAEEKAIDQSAMNLMEIVQELEFAEIIEQSEQNESKDVLQQRTEDVQKLQPVQEQGTQEQVAIQQVAQELEVKRDNQTIQLSQIISDQIISEDLFSTSEQDLQTQEFSESTLTNESNLLAIDQLLEFEEILDIQEGAVQQESVQQNLSKQEPIQAVVEFESKSEQVEQELEKKQEQKKLQVDDLLEIFESAQTQVEEMQVDIQNQLSVDQSKQQLKEEDKHVMETKTDQKGLINVEGIDELAAILEQQQKEIYKQEVGFIDLTNIQIDFLNVDISSLDIPNEFAVLEEKIESSNAEIKKEIRYTPSDTIRQKCEEIKGILLPYKAKGMLMLIGTEYYNENVSNVDEKFFDSVKQFDFTNVYFERGKDFGFIMKEGDKVLILIFGEGVQVGPIKLKLKNVKI